MQKTLTLDEYVSCFDQVATSKVVEVIKKYFGGNVDKFYAAPGNYRKWKSLPVVERTPAFTDSVFKDIRRCNFAGLEKKYVKSILGHNYYVAGFMKRVTTKLEQEFGYTIIHRGTLPYKGENHPYFTKYLPPKEKIEEIFESKQMVDIVTRPSSYCNKVKKVLETMQKDYAEKAGKDVSSWGQKKQIQNKPVKAAKSVKSPAKIFQTPYELLDAAKALLDTGAVGGPSTFKTALRPILTDYLLKDLDEYWSAKPFAVREQFNYVNWLTELPIEDKIAVYKARYDFLLKVFKQLNSANASKMFKDEYASGKFVPADEKRICNARIAVHKALLNIKDAVKLARTTTTITEEAGD